MMKQEMIPATGSFSPIVGLVVDGLTSPHSRRAYRRGLDDFLGWYGDQDRPGLKKAVVNRYKRELLDAGLAPSTINQRLTAIRKLATEAADNGLMDANLAAGIARVQGVTSGGRRSGNWLAMQQAQALLDAPVRSTLRGLRDRALLSVLLGTGLRRAEAASLAFADIQQREGRWVLVDIVGKRNKVRSVPLPCWAKATVDAWAEAARITEGRVFRPIAKGGHRLNGEAMSPQSIRNVVKGYARALGWDDLAPHDLRRTFAKLAHKGGAPIEQIQLSLGHASIRTTMQYLGVEQDLADAPCDRLGLRLG